MKTIEYNIVDKSGWPPGKWQEEPDKRQWQDRKTGLPCLAVRHPTSGHWCGYVGVEETHPLFQVHYCDDDERVYDLDVHGGITYNSFCVEDDKEHGVCHVPAPGESDRVWWFGFDCAHSNDLSPDMSADLPIPSFRGGFYRDLNYIKKECRKLARQLAAL